MDEINNRRIPSNYLLLLQLSHRAEEGEKSVENHRIMQINCPKMQTSPGGVSGFATNHVWALDETEKISLTHFY